MAIKLEMLKYFTVVAQCGSLSEAADALGRTPSAISMMLKQLEDHVGSPLFETSRKSRLTPIGQLIYDEARREINHFDSTVAAIEGIVRSKGGYLRLAVTPSTANTVLPSIIKRFATENPEVQIDIRDMDSAAIAHELMRGRADIGIGSLPKVEGMTHRKLFNDTFGVVCRKDAAFAANWNELTWQDLQDETIISNGLSEMITDDVFKSLLAKSRLNVLNTTSLLSLIREGVGISVLPEMAAKHLDEALVFLPLKEVQARRTVSVVTPRPASLIPAAKALLAMIKRANFSVTTD